MDKDDRNEEAISLIRKELRRPRSPSKPGGWYSRDGDCIFYYNEDVPYHAVRLTGLITVFEALDDGRPVGIQINGIRTLIANCGHLQLLIRKKESLEMIYLLSFALTFSRELPASSDVLTRTCSSMANWSVPVEDLHLAGTEV